MFLAGCSGSAAGKTPPTLTPHELQGQRTFQTICSNCHSTIPDSIIVGPSLAGVAERAASRVPGMDARTYILTSILKPREYIVEGFPDNLMPTNLGEILSPEEIDAVIAYLFTLSE